MPTRKRTRTEKRKGDRPETLRQAQTWEAVKTHYLNAGLCNPCAGQAAYGHQLGFTRIKNPCKPCQKIILPAKLTDRHGDRGQLWLQGRFAGWSVVVL
jgi:hypothetical protein